MEDVIQYFYSRLIKTLPMNDAIFRGELHSAGLFAGNLKNKIKSFPTSADMAECFLDDEIKNNPNNFQKLVVQMGKNRRKHVKELAEDINKMIRADQSVPGNIVHVNLYIVMLGWKCNIMLFFHDGKVTGIEP